jgi:hypothetical protein
MYKINKKYPINYEDVLLYGINLLTNEHITTIGYRVKIEDRFITPPNGWMVNFTHYNKL